KVRFTSDPPEALGHLLFDPQTSGGLLFAVAPKATTDVEGRFSAAGLGVWRIGAVVEGVGVEISA
ncbi:MAG TPA: selenide, water dikinase SelD, partial [Dehalococcoidia bacterium]|nr:selenide, water dikinase SelD [Dehalococcoidia bacterium]